MGLGDGPDSRLWPLIAVLETQPASLVQGVSPSSPWRFNFATTALLMLLGKALRLERIEDQGGD